MPAARSTRKPVKPTKSTASRTKAKAGAGTSAKSGKKASATSMGQTGKHAATIMRNATAPAGRTAKGSSVLGITPFLWFDDNFEEAARFYVKLFPDSRIEGTSPMGGSFVLAGQRFMGLNGGPQYKFTPAVSFFVVCKDQKEVDRLWAALEDGGHPTRCGWIDDKFGLTWQIVPEAFLRLTADKDPKKVGAVFQAMMGMVKMDVKGLQAAYDAA